MKNNILDKLLSHSKKTKGFIGVRKISEEDTFYVGYIVDYNDTLIVLQLISKFGLENGLLVENIVNIESFETEDDYLKSYQLFYKRAKKIGKQTVKKIQLPKSENWQYELIKSNLDKGKIVSIEFNNEDYLLDGFILDYDEIHFRFKPISNIGNDEGENVYKLSNITSITFDSLENRKIEAFYNMKKGK